MVGNGNCSSVAVGGGRGSAKTDGSCIGSGSARNLVNNTVRTDCSGLPFQANINSNA